MSLFRPDKVIEEKAQHIYSQIIALRAVAPNTNTTLTAGFQELDVNSLEVIIPRSVVVEHVSLEALKDLGLPQILYNAGFNARQKAAALGNIVGRMCEPRSELATWYWLQNKSAIGELLEFDFQSMPLMQRYRASDQLLKNKALIEEHLFENVQEFFSFAPTITLYDLTNTHVFLHVSAKIPPPKDLPRGYKFVQLSLSYYYNLVGHASDQIFRTQGNSRCPYPDLTELF